MLHCFSPPGDEEDGAYLDDKGLVLEAGTHPQLAHVGRLVDEVLDAVENSSAGGGDPTVDPSLTDGFPGDAGVSVDVLKENGVNED